MGNLCVKETHSDDEGEADSKKHHKKASSDQKKKRYEATSSSKSASPSHLVALEQVPESVGKPLVAPAYVAPGFHEYRGPFTEGEATLCVRSAHSIGPNNCIASNEDRSLCVLNFQTGHVVKLWGNAHQHDITSITSPEPGAGNVFFTSSRDRRLKAWKVEEHTEVATFEGHTLPVTSCDRNQDATQLFSGSRDNTVRLWDVETRKCLSVCDVKLNVVHFVKFIESLGIVAQGGEDLTLRLWDIREGNDASKCQLELLHTLANFDYHPICCCLPSSSATTLFTGHNGFNNQGSMITEWDLRMRKQVRHFFGHGFTVRALKVVENSESPLFGQLISASDDGSVKLWDIRDSTMNETHNLLASSHFPEGRVTSIDESLVDSGGNRGGGDALLLGTRSGCIVAAKAIDTGDHFLQRYRYIGSAGN